MPIVTISRGTFSGGRLLAEELAKKLGCDCTESEVLGEAARKFGVPVSRLKAAMVKAPATFRGFAREREMYLAAITATLGERALSGNLVYHGHAAHLLLPGVTHVLRVRVNADQEFRIKAAMARMNISREQAKKYIRGVDADRARWVDFLYGVDWSDPSHYDLIINLEHMAVSNAATAVCAVSELPEFKPTPASTLRLRDLLLAARARVRLGVDPRTAQADVVITAHNGVLSVKHLPQQASIAPDVPRVLEGLEGVRELHTAIAATSLLWIDEHFSPSSDAFPHIADLAERWDASVELLKASPEPGAAEMRTVAVRARSARQPGVEDDGGVVFDGENGAAAIGSDDEDIEATLDALLGRGRPGEAKVVAADLLPVALEPQARHCLVVVGNVFKDKPDVVRGRLARELQTALADRLGVPVVGVDDLKRRLHVGLPEAAKLVTGGLAVALVYLVVFTNQEPIIRFIAAGDGRFDRILAMGALAIGTPIFAWMFGSVLGLLARLLRFD
ncbi:MAG: cytidylate kinase-like family protein [Acidobacteriota bacterium]